MHWCSDRPGNVPPGEVAATALIPRIRRPERESWIRWDAVTTALTPSGGAVTHPQGAGLRSKAGLAGSITG
jgi:hypothetical protein